MKITVNGKEREIGQNLSLTQLLVETFKTPKGIIVILNNKIIKEQQQEDIYLNPSDNLEFVQMIGGG